jgi:hypothetical protein
MSIISLFFFKQKVYSLRKSVENIDFAILEEKKKAVMLEADRALEHSSMHIKTLADRYLHSRFTTVKQLATPESISISGLKTQEMAYMAN